MWCIQARISMPADSRGWRTTASVPTFYLDESVQLFNTEPQAVEIATRIMDPFGAARREGAEFHITAVRI